MQCMKNNLLILIFTVIVCNDIHSQADEADLFHICRRKLADMLVGKEVLNFKDAVFATENAFLDASMDRGTFDRQITELTVICKSINSTNRIKYDKKDSTTVSVWASIFKALTDTTFIEAFGDTLVLLPYRYNFDDIFGSKDWSKMFVSTLLNEGRGNCHSLPYLYKIICDELNVSCHLALAPNHIYIKHRCLKTGWYNTELTSATFPIDAWLMASGYISLQSVQNGIYLDTLSKKESIALCVLDLAQGYNHKYPDNDGKFVIECCDLALKHFPDYVNAILLKAETRLKQLQAMQKEMKYAYLKEVTAMPEGKAKWDEMNSLYMQLYKLGYRQMPEQMYVEWLTSLKTEKEKYSNKNAPGTVKD